MTTILQTISNGDNDAREAFNGGSFSSTVTALAVFSDAADANRFMAGFRFTGLTIPAGSTINAGTKMQVAYTSTSRDDPDVRIYCEATDNAVSFVTNADVQARSRTTANVLYQATGVGKDAYIDTADIDTEVQEVVGRAGWASGQDIVVIIIGDTSTNAQTELYAQEHANNYPAKIVIEYTASGSTVNMPALVLLASLVAPSVNNILLALSPFALLSALVSPVISLSLSPAALVLPALFVPPMPKSLVTMSPLGVVASLNPGSTNVLLSPLSPITLPLSFISPSTSLSLSPSPFVTLLSIPSLTPNILLPALTPVLVPTLLIPPIFAGIGAAVPVSRFLVAVPTKSQNSVIPSLSQNSAVPTKSQNSAIPA